MQKLYINPINKTLVPEFRSQKKIYVARNDKDSVCLLFEMPKKIGNSDMSLTDIQVHSVNVGEKDGCVAKDMSNVQIISKDRDTMTFEWQIPDTVTQYEGVLSISLSFAQYKDEGDTVVKTYLWSTEPFSDIVVLNTYDHTKEIAESRYDYLVATCNAIVVASLEANFAEKLDEAVGIATENAESYATKSESWAIGETGKREGENKNNAKYHSQISESYAVGGTGKRVGEETDNAKYYCEQAEKYSTNTTIEYQKTVKIKEEVETKATEVSTDKGTVTEVKSALDKDIAIIKQNISETNANMANTKSYAENTHIYYTEVSAARDTVVDKAEDVLEQHNIVMAKAGQVSIDAEQVNTNKQAVERATAKAEQHEAKAKEYAESINPRLFGNALIGKKSGKAIRIEDASPIHEITVTTPTIDLFDYSDFNNSKAYTLPIDSGKKYRLEMTVKEGTEDTIALTEENNGNTQIVDLYDGESSERVISVKIEGNEGSVYELVSDRGFDSVLSKCTLSQIVSANIYGKNLVNYNTRISGDDVRTFKLGDIQQTKTVSVGIATSRWSQGTVQLRRYIGVDENGKEVYDRTTLAQNGVLNSSSVVIDGEKKKFGTYDISVSSGVPDGVVETIQLELGDKATSYEPFKDVKNIDDIGSLTRLPYLTTTIIADSEVTVEYNRDINKVIETIENAIAKL